MIVLELELQCWPANYRAKVELEHWLTGSSGIQGERRSKIHDEVALFQLF